MISLIDEFRKLPAMLVYEGIYFQLLMKRVPGNIEIGYYIECIEKNSKHFGIDGKSWTGFNDDVEPIDYLIIAPKIRNDQHAIAACRRIEDFLVEKQLIPLL